MAIVNTFLVSLGCKLQHINLPAGSYFLGVRKIGEASLELISLTPDTRAAPRTLQVLFVEAGEFVPTHARYIGSAGELHAFTV